MVKAAKVTTISPESIAREAQAGDAPAPASSESTLPGWSVTLEFPGEDREFEFHGAKVDVSSITPAGLIYLIGLGYTTSLTQCNAGVATAMRDEGRSADEIAEKLAANREARLQKICDGTIAVRGGGSGSPRKDLEQRLLEDVAWSALQVIYARNKAKLPSKAGEKAKAISDYLSIPDKLAKAKAQVTAMLSIGED